MASAAGGRSKAKRNDAGSRTSPLRDRRAKPRTSVDLVRSGKRWTAADLYRRFGAIPLDRIRFDPPPGLAVEDDVVRINDHEDRLCELVDGVLVEKAVGYHESFLSFRIAYLIQRYLDGNPIGYATGEGGLLRLFQGMVRIPDAMFVSWDRLPGRRPLGPDDPPIPDIAPDLAIEILSKSNTRKEMDDKLRDYFKAGVRLVWYVDPRKKTVKAYTNADHFETFGIDQTLSGGDVLPGLEIPLASLFLAKEPGDRLPKG